MKILVTGSSGLVGSALTAFLVAQGHAVYRLVRRSPQNDSEIQWDPENLTLETEKLEGFDTCVHLAGENIAGKRWSEQQKQKIRDSRVELTRLLAQTFTTLKRPPHVFICASAMGYYGNRGDTILTEDSASDGSFLSSLCQAWEEATQSASVKGMRVVNTRFGLILSPKGGALQKMLPPFWMGAGGPLGNGKQYYSWVALDDVVGAIDHAIRTPSLSGPVNVVSPTPVTNHQFTKTLGKVLGRPTMTPVPAFAVKLLFGQMGEELLLSSTRVVPEKLTASGYHFLFPDLEAALRHLLGK